MAGTACARDESLLATCRLHDINPYDAVVDVLQRVGQHPASLVHQHAKDLERDVCRESATLGSA